MSKTKALIGVVLSTKMKKTIVVKVMRMSKHPKYGRIVKKFNKFKVHDEKQEARPGDVVKILECRPLSKDKRFRLLSIDKKAEGKPVELKEDVK